MDTLRIDLLGNVVINYGETQLNIKLSTKSIGILSVLICNKYKKISRQKLANMFWSDSFETASYNFRYNLWSLKKFIPNDENNQELILSDNKYCYINPNYNFSSDVTTLDKINLENENIDLETLQNVKTLFRGDFLEDYYIKECDEFNDWILMQRTTFQNMQIKILKILVDLYLEQAQSEKYKEILEEILLINPYDEDSHYRLMNLFIENNESNLAIIHYKRYESVLREELNIFPEKRIKDLYLTLIDKEISKNTIVSESILKKEEKNVILRINENADTDIDYLLISDLLEKMQFSLKKNAFQNLPKIYLEDACFIQPSFNDLINSYYYKSNVVPDVRLYHSIKNILNLLTKDYNIQIYIYNKDKIDKKSEKFLKLLNNSSNLYIKYVENQ